MPRMLRLILPLLAVVAAATGLTVAASPAYAASLTSVASFGSNPGNLTMYSYRPDGMPSGAPLVVAMHGCTQNATDYFTNAGWRKYADLWKFALVLPEQKSANNSTSCFNWFETGDTARGGGEALSIKQMVDYAVANYGVNASRVYVTGLSAGGAMTAVMLATYPDVFAGGAIMAGIAYRCATSTLNAYSCMNPGVDKTPAAWGDLVRAAYSGYSGARPRVAIWHGTSDTTVAPANATELRDQWTNVLGVSQTPTSTASLPGGTSLSDYGDKVRVYLVSGMTHATPVDPGSATEQCGTAGTYYKDTICSSYYQAKDWGLDNGTASPTASPTASASPTATPTQTAGPCVRASNYAHVTAGRAHMSGGYVYANGSNQSMGLYNVFTTHGLQQTGANYWVIADALC
ncbi:PHB depolymerase family esterase [Dactylosporangium sp. AC04546]|uniref:extracellular catalytic domain type 1 short-chain-length polyhydroxyalkanoate depolymerase n=1 Tax=Dactylosporangium sp. AC04546 TaxID=2862460 RepID=UPI001EDD4ED0|nr:PHB depolymerase family esterase [Dactylosporangium sp. AC04546]WVK82248.1 PHB depolymerase family esterase [Dactylosporangium sp. AC04546]